MAPSVKPGRAELALLGATLRPSLGRRVTAAAQALGPLSLLLCLLPFPFIQQEGGEGRQSRRPQRREGPSCGLWGLRENEWLSLREGGRWLQTPGEE